MTTYFNDVVVEKVINIDQNSRIQTAVESVWSVSKLLTESVGSRRELDGCEFCSHRRGRRNSTRQQSRVGGRRCLFTHPPPLGGADAYMFYSLFFFVFLSFFPSATTIVHKYETTVLGNG